MGSHPEQEITTTEVCVCVLFFSPFVFLSRFHPPYPHHYHHCRRRRRRPLFAPSAHSRYAVRERVSENELIYDEVIRMFLRFPKNN